MSNTISISAFAEKIQKEHGAPIEFTNLTKTGPDHIPLIRIELIVPGVSKPFIGFGKNKKIAKQEAVNKAFNKLFNH